jgi:regulator of protease activity HflC (stomatin/prohibitin superfamily)
VFGFKIITQFEQGIVFRWGRALPGVRGPGLTWVNPFTDRLRKVNMQNYAFAVSQVAQTSLRSVIGQSDMDQLLSERERRARIISADGEYQASNEQWLLSSLAMLGDRCPRRP